MVEQERFHGQPQHGGVNRQGLHVVGKAEGIVRSLKRRVYPAHPLQDILWDNIQKNRLPRKKHVESFLAESQIEDIIHVESVEQEIARSYRPPAPSLIRRLLEPDGDTQSPEARRQLAERICGNSKHASTSEGLNDNESETTTSPKSFRKVLAILTLIDLSHKIKSFVDLDVCDHDLPLTFKMSEVQSSTCWYIHRCSNSESALPCFKKPEWSKHSISRFKERQWSMLAPSFSLGTKSVALLHFARNTIIPFTFYEPFTRGSSCQLFKVKIHPGYHDFQDLGQTPPVFAVKQFKLHDEKTFAREIAILKRFNDNQPHLISLLASYKQHDLYNLIFPWAETDLHGFWSRIKPTILQPEEERILVWMAAQCHGIVDGLSQIHYHRTYSGRSLLHPDSIPKLSYNKPQTETLSNVFRIHYHLFGRHGDIKPENILWFPDRDTSPPDTNILGTLKIADFGIAEFSTQTAVDGRRRRFVASSPLYRAPELDVPRDEVMRLSSSYDIWSLGCVFLEFVTWWFGGWTLVESFKRQRCLPDPMLFGYQHGDAKAQSFFTATFFTFTKAEDDSKYGPTVKTAVTEFIKRLKKDSKSRANRRFITQFLQMIEDDMLIVDPKRKNSKTIAHELETLCSQADWPQWNSLTRTSSLVSIQEEIEGDETSQLERLKL